MPVLRARPEPNDGGYAVADYGAIEPALGTMDDLRALAAELRAHGMALCVDVVLNHTAQEHAWARAALAGDPAKLAFYRTFPDRTEPDAYERTLPEVFPDIAPGSFTWVPGLGRWVWTTFNTYQWDLDYTNPAVFRAMAEVVLELADAGVDVLRLDAVPFLWKRIGTDCQNQPEVHELLQALRAVARIAAPAVGFKAEAIVAPRQLVTYLGTGRHQAKECDLAYNNVLMALLWSALASGRVALMTHVLSTHARRAARLGLGDLRALPRRHRLGDHARGRRRGGGGRRAAPALPLRLLRRRLPRRRSRAARGSSPTRRRARRARAARPRRSPGLEAALESRRRGRARARDPADPAALRASRSRTAGCR